MPPLSTVYRRLDFGVTISNNGIITAGNVELKLYTDGEKLVVIRNNRPSTTSFSL